MTQPEMHNTTSHHIGTRLRLRREALGLSVDEVAQMKNLRPEYLRNIETLHVDALPSIGYVLGFVRSYAKAVNMDGEHAVADYKADVQVPENLYMRDQPHFVPKRKVTLPSGFVPALMTVSLAVIFTVWYSVQTRSNTDNSAEIIAYQDLSDEVLGPAPITDAQLLTLRAYAPSWVQVKESKGEVLISRILVEGQTWQGPKNRAYIVSVRDAGAIRLYDGQNDLGFLGARGQTMIDIPILSKGTN